MREAETQKRILVKWTERERLDVVKGGKRRGRRWRGRGGSRSVLLVRNSIPEGLQLTVTSQQNCFLKINKRKQRETLVARKKCKAVKHQQRHLRF